MKIRAAQIDLARQKETVEYVISYADFLGAHGFNAMFVYLEGMIRTKSLNSQDESVSYSEDEIREIVGHCETIGIQAIPIVEALSHSDWFLEAPGLESLAEVQHRYPGRFFAQGRLGILCPSMKETRQFYRAYMGEVAALFPSPYFHVGLDEIWELGMCDVCEARMRKDGKADGLLADFILFLHGALARRKKTLMMWDDMFEIYPDALEPLPRDIVMVTWCYQHLVHQPRGHFLHLEREDTFGRYDRLGFPYMLATGPHAATNIESFTRYASQHKPLGGAVTLWERSRSFNFDSYPVIAYAGALWGADEDAGTDPLREVLAQLVESDDPLLLDALDAFYRLRHDAMRYGFSPVFARGELEPLEEEHAAALRLIHSVLTDRGDDGNAVVEDVRIGIESCLADFGIREALGEGVRGFATGRLRAAVRAALDAQAHVAAQRTSQWGRYRPGIPHRHVTHHVRGMRRTLDQFLTRHQESNYRLSLKLFLPDRYAVPYLDVVVHGSDDSRATVLERASLKPNVDGAAYFEVMVPFHMETVPTAVTASVYGYGGQGLTYVEVVGRRKELRPVGVAATDGQVRDPTALLTDDLRWCYLGEREARRGFRWNRYAELTHSVTLNLGA